jgi:hypothetical protein
MAASDRRHIVHAEHGLAEFEFPRPGERHSSTGVSVTTGGAKQSAKRFETIGEL